MPKIEEINQLEKMYKKVLVENFPQNYRFLSLIVVARALNKEDRESLESRRQDIPKPKKEDHARAWLQARLSHWLYA